MLSQESIDSQSPGEMDGILNEPMPPEMNEQAYEAVAEELGLVQVKCQKIKCLLLKTEIVVLLRTCRLNPSSFHAAGGVGLV